MATTTLAAVFWAAGGLTSLPAALAQPQHATVLSIGDGDTIRVRQDSGLVRVRLACIDAPETSQSPWGAAARRELQELLPIGHAVEVRRKATDRYGRTVAEVFSGGRNINQALVGSGAAFVYWQYITGCDRNAYSRLETEARLRRLGVWSIPGGITRPWNHRRMRQTGQAQSGSEAQRSRCCRRQATVISMAQRRRIARVNTWEGDAQAFQTDLDAPSARHFL